MAQQIEEQVNALESDQYELFASTYVKYIESHAGSVLNLAGENGYGHRALKFVKLKCAALAKEKRDTSTPPSPASIASTPSILSAAPQHERQFDDHVRDSSDVSVRQRKLQYAIERIHKVAKSEFYSGESNVFEWIETFERYFTLVGIRDN